MPAKLLHQAVQTCGVAGSESQSTKCVEYIFSYQTLAGMAVQVHVIDTPGLSDTGGMLIFDWMHHLVACKSFMSNRMYRVSRHAC